ncbi:MULTISPECIES: hypothetical protein [Aquimarina]|uniref:Uncharacterized protein n=1 Tax=Aquimarina algiphila TaxID=2047982 RepID=A0A554VE83_9FLAO|nr:MULTISPECIES: hypothetical protein [Aquimarina]TSE05265.1 hypothetical protein FOF46_23685 [Aquimarina algiphila]
MKIISALFLFFFMTTDVIRIEDIRDSYKTCTVSKEKADQFYELTEKALQNDGAIYQGYHGAALALKASFSWNPFNKLSYFNKSKKVIDKSIELEPDNIELRMIRLSIQSNAPKLAGYYKNIEEDRDFMLANIDKVNNEGLKAYLKGFIEHSDVFSNSN